jgi:hypothetical protein
MPTNIQLPEATFTVAESPREILGRMVAAQRESVPMTELFCLSIDRSVWIAPQHVVSLVEVEL